MGILHSQLQDLIDKGFLPEDPTIVNLEDAIEYSKFKSLSWEEKLAIKETAIVVCDGAKWAIPDELGEDGEILPSTTFYSGDGVNVYRHLRRSKFCICKVSEYGIVNAPLEALYINKNESMRGDSRMNNLPDLDQFTSELEKDLQVSTGGAANSEAFVNESDDSASNTSSTNPIVSELRKMSNAVEVSSAVSNFHAYMQENSTLLGYITRNDAYIASYYKPVVENRDELLPTAPPDVREMFNGPNKSKIRYSYFKHHFDIMFKQVRPGAVLGVAIEAPTEMNIDFLMFTSPDFKFERPQTVTKRKYLFKRQEAFGIMVYNFPSGIKEDPRTHPHEQDIIEVIANYVKVKGSDQARQNRRLIGRNRRYNYIRETNYLPINTFKTVNLTKPQFTEEEQEGLNRAAFFNLAKTIGDEYGKFALLNKEHKKNLEGTTDKLNIKSTYFAATLNERELIEVDSFHTKGQKLEVVEFPVKKLNTKDKDGVISHSATHEKINALNKEVNASRDERSSLYSPKFKLIRDVLGPDLVSVSKLAELARASSSSAKESKNYSRGTELFRLTIANTHLPGVEVDSVYTDAKQLRAAVQREMLI